MTRQEFIEIEYWQGLIDFCYDKDIGFCDDLYSEEDYDEKINSELEEIARNDNWEDVRDWLDGLPNGYEYYIRDDFDGWRAVDDEDFESIKGEILEFMDNSDYWDDYEEEEIEEDDPENEIPIEDEDVSFAELFTICSSKVQKIGADKIADDVATEQAFEELCVSIGVTVAVEGSN